MATKKAAAEAELVARVTSRVAHLEAMWNYHATRPGKALIIRPRLTGDDYTTLGSNVWAANAKQKAIDQGWTVVDLDAGAATRTAIENAITTEQPDLIMHFDHGSEMTMWGQSGNSLQAGIDDANINLASGRIISTVSCLSAAGLGPAGIAAGVRAYLGYNDLHGFWTGYQDMFGAAANAANYALLECKTMQEAFDAAWAAYDQLYNDLLAMGGFAATYVAPTALDDRDRLTLLGSTGAVACPQVLICRIGGPGTPCLIGLPGTIHCKIGLPDTACKVGLPGIPQCIPGAPDTACKLGGPGTVHCMIGLPDSVVCAIGGPTSKCKVGLPDSLVCKSGLPDTVVVICKGGGPQFEQFLECAAGPGGPLLFLKDELVTNPDVLDLVVIDMSRVPRELQKPMRELFARIQKER